MNAGKFTIKMLLVMMVILIGGELYHSFFSSFSEFPYVIFGGVTKGLYEERFGRVCKLLDDNGFEYFVRDVCFEDNDTITYIYCNPSVKDELIKKYHFEGAVGSIIGGCSELRYRALSEFTQRSLVSESNEIYLFNYDKVNVSYDFLQKVKILSDHSDKDDLIKPLYVVLYVLLFILCLFCTCYECLLKRKEWMVKIINGYPAGRLFISKTIEDILSLLLIFCFEGLILNRYFEYRFLYKHILAAFVVFMIADVVVYYKSVYRRDYKLAFSGSLFSKKLFDMSGAIRFLLVILSLIFVYVCGNGLDSIKEYKKQSGFYEIFKGYSHPQFVISEDENNSDSTAFLIEDTIYSETLEKWNVIQWEKGNILFNDMEYDAVYSNINATDILSRLLPSVSFSDTEDDTLYIFVPEGKIDSENEEIRKTLRINQRGDSGRTKIKYLSYKEHISFYAFSGSADTDISGDIEEVNDPVIYYNTEKVISEARIRESYFICDYGKEACRVEKEDFDKYIAGKNNILKGNLIDIYKQYENRVNSEKNKIKISLTVFAILFVLDMFVLGTNIKMEMSMNSMESAIKKINGSPFMERYKYFFISEIKIFGVLLLLYPVLMLVFKVSLSVPVLLAVLLMISTDILCFIFKSRKWERTSLHKVIKGGAL